MTNKTAHTPGPWLDRGNGWVEGADCFTVAKVTSDVNADREQAETDANARLIAAAPELLEALRAILTYSEGTADTSSRCVEVEDAARVAIAKATGDNSNA